MPTPTKGARLGGSPSHERIILANLASQLFEHKRIVTTEAKARRVRPLAEKLITKAKRGDLHSRRQVMTTIRDKNVVHVLFTEIGPSFEGREGGYTRITKVGPRKGDNAPMAVIELVTESIEDSKKANAKDSGAATKAPAKKAAAVADVKEYGEGSFRGEEPPAGFDIKGNEDSMKYHTTESPWYGATVAEVWFNTEDAAQAAGFVNAQGESAAAASTDDADAAVAAETAEPATLVSDEAAAADVKDYGQGSFRGEEPPAGFDIKGNEDSMKFHTSASQWYDATVAEVWFDSEASAEAAGFTKAG